MAYLACDAGRNSDFVEVPIPFAPDNRMTMNEEDLIAGRGHDVRSKPQKGPGVPLTRNWFYA